MPAAPDKPFDPAAIARDKAAKAKSPAYRKVHPTTSVYEFVRIKDHARQRKIDRECEEIEAGLRQWVPATNEQLAHWLVRPTRQAEWIVEKPAP